MKRAYTKPILQLEEFLPFQYASMTSCIELICSADFMSKYGQSGSEYLDKNNDASKYTHGTLCMDHTTGYNGENWYLSSLREYPESVQDRYGEDILFYTKNNSGGYNDTPTSWEDLDKNNLTNKNVKVTWTETDPDYDNGGAGHWYHEGYIVKSGTGANS